MSSNKLGKSRYELAMMQSAMVIDNPERLVIVRAMESLDIAKEMYAMLETALSEMHGLIDEVNDQRMSHVNSMTETSPDLHDGQTIHEIQVLLAKVRGDL